MELNFLPELWISDKGRYVLRNEKNNNKRFKGLLELHAIYNILALNSVILY